MLDEATANDPMAFCRSQSTAGVSLLMKRFGIAGYASSVHTACASGGQALGTALRVIRRGAADRVLAGGFDSMVSPVGLAGFCLLSAVSPDNDTPERASRPFDATRNGFLLGRGRGLRRARGVGARRARAARASTPSSPATATRCRRTGSPIRTPPATVRSRRCSARCATPAPSPADVDYLNAHGTSTPMNDRSEAAAAAVVFGDGVGKVAVSSTKSVMGHLIAAAGAVEAVVCTLAIHRRHAAAQREPAPSSTRTARTSTSSATRRASAACASPCRTRWASAAATAASRSATRTRRAALVGEAER